MTGVDLSQIQDDAMAVHADGRKANWRRIDVTIFSANGNSWDADEIEASPQGDEI